MSAATEALPTQVRGRWLPRLALASPTAALLLLGGCAVALLQRELLEPGWLLAFLAAAGLLARRPGMLRWPALLLLGFAWTSLHGHWALQARLPASLEGADLLLSGRVTDLPRPGQRRIGFGFKVDRADAEGLVLVGHQLRLSWYGNALPDVEPGSRWQLAVRLKRPRGVLNPGGFDFERHALQQRIAATGYVRDSSDNLQFAPASGIDALRLGISDAIAAQVDRPGRRFLQGLAVGDTRGLDSSDWEILRATGLSHLLAISGLHIGLVAGFGALLARLLYAIWPALGLRLPRPQGAAVFAVIAATAYAVLAGFGLPTQRSLTMIVAALLAVLLRRSLHPAQALSLAALVILLVDPLAVLGAGFWLSFLGVMWLLLCMPATAGAAAAAGSLLRAQWSMSLGLLPLTLWFFGQASVAGALANLVAVPWVTLVVVPMTLLGTLLVGWLPTLAYWPLQAGALAMEGLWWLAGWLAALPWAQFHVAEASLPALLLALCGVGWLLLPRAVPGKPFALLLLLPMLLPARTPLAAGEYELTLLDVGQGLSVLLRNPQQTLLYDAGPAFDGGLDMGEAVVVPALRALGVRRLDALVVSHGDNDHAGGAEAVRRAWPQLRILAGEPSKLPEAEPCESGTAWTADAVAVEILHPPAHFPELGNDSSCVLRVDGTGGALLLAGDIGTVVEQRLLRVAPQRLPARLLMVPHHGSNGSSSAPFVAAVDAELALVSTGHRNRFGHPREEVLQRYREQGTALLDTAEHGAVTVRVGVDGSIDVQQRRDSHRRFWHER